MSCVYKRFLFKSVELITDCIFKSPCRFLQISVLMKQCNQLDL